MCNKCDNSCREEKQGCKGCYYEKMDWDAIDIYLWICDEVFEKIKSNEPKTRDDVYEIAYNMKDDLIDKIIIAFDDIAWDFCKDNNIYDEEI